MIKIKTAIYVITLMWVCNHNNYRVSKFFHKLTKYELSNFPFVLIYNCIDERNSELLTLERCSDNLKTTGRVNSDLPSFNHQIGKFLLFH